jgi:hypothetical protein
MRGRNHYRLNDHGSFHTPGVFVIGCNSSARGAPDCATNDCAITAAHFIANGGTDTTANRASNRRIDRVVTGRGMTCCDHQNCEQK